MTFDEIAIRLTPEGRELLLEMVDRHLSTPDAPYRHFLVAETWGGALLIRAGGSDGTAIQTSRSTLNDLTELGLLRVGHRGRNASYEVRVDTIRFVNGYAPVESRGGCRV